MQAISSHSKIDYMTVLLLNKLPELIIISSSKTFNIYASPFTKAINNDGTLFSNTMISPQQYTIPNLQ